ncbi:hypothetical protein Bbelb_240500 [Branchiostoma belcheri]|nr:hypothetical protein Bbelb_240500 [Branchiostoma belcheri]
MSSAELNVLPQFHDTVLLLATGSAPEFLKSVVRPILYSLGAIPYRESAIIPRPGKATRPADPDLHTGSNYLLVSGERYWVVIFPTNLCLESTDRSRQAAAGRLHPPRQPMSPVLRHPFPGPDRAVGRGQEVSLRSVPVYMQRPSAKNGHNGAQDGQRAPSLPGVPDPGKLTTDGPDTEQTVHVKPPPDTPSSPETTAVCIPGPGTSILGPGRAVRPVTPPETDVTAVPGTADATRPI